MMQSGFRPSPARAHSPTHTLTHSQTLTQYTPNRSFYLRKCSDRVHVVSCCYGRPCLTAMANMHDTARTAAKRIRTYVYASCSVLSCTEAKAKLRRTLEGKGVVQYIRSLHESAPHICCPVDSTSQSRNSQHTIGRHVVPQNISLPFTLGVSGIKIRLFSREY